MIRTFVGIPLPGAVVRDLTAAQAGLPAGRAVAPENFHLTLAFIGEHPEPVIEDLHLALDRITGAGFQVSLAGAGLFGNKRPRVLYAGVRSGPELGRLREKVVQAARGAEIPLARERYTPHVTLARLNSGLSPEDAAELRDFAARRAGFSTAPFRIEGFALFRSTLGRNGAIYEALAKYPLDK
ncbi:MAG: RNA 2',3'-cyclic phosphodiesterase [Paracoccaceae bacterium]|nr:RNA 2',3'-cyclic phosphodiesterase [Paracoccaceae bacterium]